MMDLPSTAQKPKNSRIIESTIEQSKKEDTQSFDIDDNKLHHSSLVPESNHVVNPQLSLRDLKKPKELQPF